MPTLPRVTAILDDLGLGADYLGVHPAVLEVARIRGGAVHRAIEAEVYGYGNDALLSEDVLVRLDAYRAFVKDSGYQTTHTEIEVTHVSWRYRGHPDTVGWLAARRVILDWKVMDSVQLAPAALQLAGYRAAWNAQHPTQPVEGTAVVQLKGDGTYRYHAIDPTVHEPTWFAACAVYHAKRERR